MESSSWESFAGRAVGVGDVAPPTWPMAICATATVQPLGAQALGLSGQGIERGSRQEFVRALGIDRAHDAIGTHACVTIVRTGCP